MIEMNQNTQIRSTFREQNRSDILILAIEKQLEIEPKSKKLLINLNQYWEIVEFQLGDLIDNIAATNLVRSQKATPQNQFFYLICQGRVRLLSFDAEKQREVSTGADQGDSGANRAVRKQALPRVRRQACVRLSRIPRAAGL